MHFDQLKSGTRVQIQRRGDSPTGGYMCKVEVLLPEERELLVHAPIEGGRLVRFDQGENCSLRLLTENAIYRFKAKLLAHGDVDGFDVVRFKLIGDGEKVQRRSAFRFNCALPVNFSVIYTSGQQGAREEGLIVDLSAMGAKMYADSNIQTGYLLNISIQLGDELVVAFGDVRTKKEMVQQSKYSYQYGVRFAMMPEADQEGIIRYMYKMQREELKKARPR